MTEIDDDDLAAWGRWNANRVAELESETAALRAERDALRYDIAVVTHLVDPGDPLADEKVRQLSRLALSDGLRDQCVVRVDAAEAEAEALRAERDRLVAGLTALEQHMRQVVRGLGAGDEQVLGWADELAALRRTPE